MRKKIFTTKNSLALTFLVISLALRIFIRGHYYPGWDLMGSGHGYFTLSNAPFFKAVVQFWVDSRDFFYWNHSNSLVYTLITGGLNFVIHWQYWAHALTFLLWLATLLTIFVSTKCPTSKLWILILGWLASPNLLAFSIAGYPYILGALPFVLGLALLKSHWWRTQPMMFLLGSLLVCELSWHLYETGKMVWVLFVACAFLFRGLGLFNRLSLLIASGIQLAQLRRFSGSNIDFFSNLKNFKIDQYFEIPPTFVSEMVQGHIWTPFLFFAAISVLLASDRRRIVDILMFGIGFGLMAMLFLKGPYEWRGRRFLTSDILFLLVIVRGFRDQARNIADGPKLFRHAYTFAIVSLIFGSLFQLYQLFIFTKVPFRDRPTSLPGYYSQSDYGVYYDGIDVANWILERVADNQTVIWLYNLDSYPENNTDPASLLERVYLTMGDKKFKERVKVFGQNKSR